MSRTPAKVTQADVARTIRAAMQAGASGVEVRPDGTIFVHFSAPQKWGKVDHNPSFDLEDKEIVEL